jgi:hypothetical protein
MTMKTGSELRFEVDSWQEAAHDVYIGLVVGLGHVYKIFVQMPYNYVAGTEAQPRLQESGELKVVGVGFGRTGTVSIVLYRYFHCIASSWFVERLFLNNNSLVLCVIRANLGYLFSLHFAELDGHAHLQSFIPYIYTVTHTFCLLHHSTYPTY